MGLCPAPASGSLQVRTFKPQKELGKYGLECRLGLYVLTDLFGLVTGQTQGLQELLLLGVPLA